MRKLSFLLFAALLSVPATVLSQDDVKNFIKVYENGTYFEYLLDSIKEISFDKHPFTVIDKTLEFDACLDYEGAIAFTTNEKLTARIDVDWCYAKISKSPDSYYGSYFELWSQANTADSNRYANMFLINEDGVCVDTILLIQRKYELAFLPRYFEHPVLEAEVELPQKADNYRLYLAENTGWEVDEHSSWIRPIKDKAAYTGDETLAQIMDSTKSLSDYVSFFVERNPADSIRTGFISLKGHGQTIKAIINQLGNLNTLQNIYAELGAPGSCDYYKPDDFGLIMNAFSTDIEAADVVLPDTSYNWFSTCGELSSRTATYRNPLIRYQSCYNVIDDCNFLLKYATEEMDSVNKVSFGQTYAIRAFAYLNLAPYYQFRYIDSLNAPCVPIVTTETIDPSNNPRASVKEVYDLIVSDLTKAIELLDGWVRPSKSYIDQQVAYGLRARANLNMGRYAYAIEDAAKAVAGYSPASMQAVSHPFLMDISESNWIWGYDMTKEIASEFRFATSSSWIRSFSGKGYSTACRCYSAINRLLYDKIPDTDVRKGWWVNTNLESPLLDGLTWGDMQGQEIASTHIPDKKEQFLPYTNVKFGCYVPGTLDNDEDWCWMRAEEMILIEAEGYAHLGNADIATKLLNSFVQEYRDSTYDAAASGRSLLDEIWFQRRVELWGEGFSNNDTRRLGKPLVRFHENEESNVPERFRFNMTADDGWWLMRFTKKVLDANPAIIDNKDGKIPEPFQNGDLRDGVTD